MVYSLEDSQLDATFSNIENRDNNNRPHSVETIRFTDVPVDAGGTYEDRQSADDYIQGFFAGPNQAETVGVFEKENIVGAFGARKQ